MTARGAFVSDAGSDRPLLLRRLKSGFYARFLDGLYAIFLSFGLPSFRKGPQTFFRPKIFFCLRQNISVSTCVPKHPSQLASHGKKVVPRRQADTGIGSVSFLIITNHKLKTQPSCKKKRQLVAGAHGQIQVFSYQLRSSIRTRLAGTTSTSSFITQRTSALEATKQPTNNTHPRYEMVPSSSSFGAASSFPYSTLYTRTPSSSALTVCVPIALSRDCEFFCAPWL